MARPRNVIILSSDEMRGDCPGYAGNPDCRTPCLDRLAADSVVFDRHFTVHGKCVPSRISLVTGRYAHTDGYRTITQHMPQAQPNLVGALKAAGYETALFGHPHVAEDFWGDNRKGTSWTDYHSYTEGVFRDLLERRWPCPPAAADAPARVPMADGEEESYSGLREGEQSGFCDENRAEQAIKYLRDVRDRDRPFFLQVNFGAPHPKYRVAEPYFSMYARDRIAPWPHALPEGAPLPLRAMREVRTGRADERMFREIQAVYYGMITNVDRQIGRVLDAVAAEGLLEESVILFWVDHGDFAGQYGLYEKWDTAMQDCIMRVPCLLRAPGLPGGRRVDALTETTDLAPTICELLGIDPFPGIHGQSLLPAIRGEARKEAVFADGGHEPEMLRRFAARFAAGDRPKNGKQRTYLQYPGSMARTKMVRTETHKLVIRLEGGNELYDLRDDPHELRNRYGDPALGAAEADLLRRLAEWSLRTDTDQPRQQDYGA